MHGGWGHWNVRWPIAQATRLVVLPDGVSEAIDLRFDGLVAFLVGRGAPEITSEVVAEPVGHVPHE